MELDLVNEWSDDNLLFRNYTVVDIGWQFVNLTSQSQRTFTFIICGLGFRLFWKV